jgi:hypothetical protein
MRKHGLSVDNLQAIAIVTADGKLLRARRMPTWAGRTYSDCLTGTVPTAKVTAGHRYILIGIGANWSEQADSEANTTWARNLRTALQPFSSGGNYLNFPGYVENREEMLLGAHGGNLPGLRSIKAVCDPGNLFPGLLHISPKEKGR